LMGFPGHRNPCLYWHCAFLKWKQSGNIFPLYFHYLGNNDRKRKYSGNEEEIRRKRISTIFPLPIARRFSSRYCVSDWYGSNPRISIKASVPIKLNLCIRAPVSG
jgi:hypothetical protein